LLIDGECRRLRLPGEMCDNGDHNQGNGTVCVGSSQCIGSVCRCEPGMQLENGECIDSNRLANPGASCANNRQCMGASVCHRDAWCICSMVSNPFFDRCEPMLGNVHAGGVCMFTFHCQMGLICLAGVCKCLPSDVDSDDCPAGEHFYCYFSLCRSYRLQYADRFINCNTNLTPSIIL
jgi:hypothetical protein